MFLLWISSRQPHDRYVEPSVLREIVQKAPNWLTERTSDGRVVIDTMALPDELDSEIKRTLLDQEIADVPDRPKSKRRF